MKLAIIFTVAIVALLNSDSADGSPYGVARSRRDADLQVCQPGDRKKEDCNTCFCIADGSGWDCTRMECYTGIITLPSGDPLKRVQRQVSKYTNSQVCQPGDRKMEDCNNCFCKPNGSGWACTKRGCYDTHVITLPSGDPSERVKREIHGSLGDPEFRCTPGMNFKDDCNWCTCTRDGRNAYCTLMECFGI